MSRDSPPPSAVLDAFGLATSQIAPIPSGLINRSFLASASSSQRAVLQRVSDIFDPRLEEDLAAVTAHLASRGSLTPRLVPTTDGRLTFNDSSGGRWRVWSYINGISNHALASTEHASRAGRLVADFHAALLDFEHQFHSPRLGVHDTAAHIRRLRTALDSHRGHRSYDRVEPLARQVLALMDELPVVPETPVRVVHGDLKISNVLFDRDGQALCLVDLDTVGWMPLPLELGDAMRSWCNPSSEDDPEAHFQLDYFKAAMTGYATGARSFISTTEWRAILPATLLITAELAARFCSDALNECYFAWDDQRFGSASDHNQARTRGQLALADSIQNQWVQASAALEAVFQS